MSLKSIFSGAIKLTDKHAPTILTVLGAGGVISTAIFTARAVIAAQNDVKALNDRTKVEVFQDSWAYFVPPVVSGVLTITCIVASNRISLSRQAAIAGAYTIAENALKAYETKIVDTLGEKQHVKIMDSIAEDYVRDHPLVVADVVHTGNGQSLCYDTLSGRYFRSEIEKLKAAQNQLNHELLGTHWMSLNDFYQCVGIDNIELGEDVGWTPDRLLEIYFTAMVAETGEPCVVMQYQVKPKWGDYNCR